MVLQPHHGEFYPQIPFKTSYIHLPDVYDFYSPALAQKILPLLLGCHICRGPCRPGCWQWATAGTHPTSQGVHPHPDLSRVFVKGPTSTSHRMLIRSVRRNLCRQSLKNSKYLVCHVLAVPVVIYLLFQLCLSFCVLFVCYLFLSLQFCLLFFCHVNFVCHFDRHFFGSFFGHLSFGLSFRL